MAEADGPGIGRIRMRVIQDAPAASLHAFVRDCVEPGSDAACSRDRGAVEAVAARYPPGRSGTSTPVLLSG